MPTKPENTEDVIEDVKEMVKERQSLWTYLSWVLLIGTAAFSIYTQSWNMVFLTSIVLILTLLPFLFQSMSGLRLPRGFVGGIVFFIVSTLFLGEIGDFYERFWWWDAVLHTGSAIGFSMIGVLLVLYLVKGNRLRAPHWMLAVMAFCFAMAIGAVWEIFEFAVDQILGLNMQKSGLRDTMWDLIVDAIGAVIGSIAGYIYVKRRGANFLSNTLEKIVRENPQHFR